MTRDGDDERLETDSNRLSSAPLAQPARVRPIWRIIRRVAVVAASVAILIVVVVVAIQVRQHASDRSGDGAQSDARYQPKPPTDEQKKRMDGIVTLSGVIRSLDGDKLEVVSSDDKLISLSMDHSTKYSRGYYGYPATVGDVKSGQRAEVLYDSARMVVISLWVEYDAQ